MLRCGFLVGFLALISANLVPGEEDLLRRAASELDRAATGSTRVELCSDEEFVRRAHLEIVGRIPTALECQSFFDSTDPDKRAALTDALLEQPGHTSRMFNFWVDLLRVRTKLNNQVSGTPYIHWLKSAVATGKPYDEMVRELLTAEGPAHERDNGATGYFLRDRGMPEDNMSNTLRAFLGTRIECAQCHDHPFDQWTQKQFFEMTAFTGGMEYRAKLKDLPNADTYREVSRELKEEGGNGAMRGMRQLLRPTLSGVYGSGTGLVRLPKDYQYDDAKPRAWVQANSIFGAPLSIENEPPTPKRRGKKNKNRSNQAPNAVDSRAAFADWVTDTENPFFTKSIVNRLWKRVMGRGLIEPVDTLDFESKASNPQLLAKLERLMIEVDYDVDAFLRVVYRTSAWQAKAVADEPTSDGVAAPLVRRMSAEQVWDSLLTLVVEDLDDEIDESGALQAEEAYAGYEMLTTSSKDDLIARVSRRTMRMMDPDAFRESRREERRAKTEERRKLMKEHPELVRALRKARRNGDKEAEQRALAALEAVGVEARPSQRQRELQRASELKLPAPNGHFLRQFGQSDHEQIDGAHTEPSVPQVLSLLNGAVETALVQNPEALLNRQLTRAKNAGEKIELAFLAVLGRKPTKSERGVWIEDFRSNKKRATGDLLWTLVNSHEFLFVQ